MVRDPAKHRCSSYPYHGLAQDDPLLSPFPEWEELGPTQAERRRPWRAKDSALIAVLRCLWRAGSGLRAIPGSTAKPRQFDTVQSSGRRGTTALRARPETDLRRCHGFLRPGRRSAVAPSRPPSGAGGRGLALPPAHRGVTTRARRLVRTFASRQRPQPHASDRNAAESIPRAVQRSS